MISLRFGKSTHEPNSRHGRGCDDATMVDQPYVNHIPTMAGGVGHDELKRFYKYHSSGPIRPEHEHDADQPDGRH